MDGWPLERMPTYSTHYCKTNPLETDTALQQGPAISPLKHRTRIYPCASCATFSPPSTPSCPVCLSLSLSLSVPWSLSRLSRAASGSGSVLLLHTPRHHSIATQSETDRKTHPVAAFLLCFPRPAWISFSFSFSQALDCSLVNLTTTPLHPHHPNKRLAAYRRPSLPEESGLLACRLSPRPTSLRTRAMRPTRWSLRRNSSYQDRGFPALSRYSRVTTS